MTAETKPRVSNPAVRIAELTLRALERMNEAVARFKRVVLASSMGAEDVVLMDLVATQRLPIEVFTIDTGRLPAETYTLMQRVREHYGLDLKVYFPDARTVEAYVRDNGINAFYQSVELRRACCHVRKVEPLGRALRGADAWVTGLRREQAVTRSELPVDHWDADHGLYKLNPLAEWTDSDVWAYIHTRNVPYNELHDRHYPSIGCAPCTRAITVGEDVRAGRWWWENPDVRECGLHRPQPVATGG